jgi:predicted O-methyltransferase YrrM
MIDRLQRVRYALRDLPNRLRNWLYALPTVDIDEIAPGVEAPDSFITEKQIYPPQEDNSYEHDDISAYLRIILSESPDSVLELGTGRGNGTANICAFSDAHVYSVNALPEQISGELTTFALSRKEIGEVYRGRGFENQVTQIYANTTRLDLDEYIDDESIDLAIIDACHDTEFVLNDFLLVHPKLSPGGIALLHDTHPSREMHLQGSYDACTKLRRQGYDIRRIEQTWWGYYRKPRNA